MSFTGTLPDEKRWTLVLDGCEGRAFGSYNARHWFEDAIENAGIMGFTCHDLRHTFDSRLVMAGVDISTVAALMGHRRIQMTMRHAHLAPDHKQNAVERLCATQNA